jgi:hypothetical protein
MYVQVPSERGAPGARAEDTLRLHRHSYVCSKVGSAPACVGVCARCGADFSGILAARRHSFKIWIREAGVGSLGGAGIGEDGVAGRGRSLSDWTMGMVVVKSCGQVMCVYDTVESLVEVGPSPLGSLCGRECLSEPLFERADVLPGVRTTLCTVWVQNAAGAQVPLAFGMTASDARHLKARVEEVQRERGAEGGLAPAGKGMAPSPADAAVAGFVAIGSDARSGLHVEEGNGSSDWGAVEWVVESGVAEEAARRAEAPPPSQLSYPAWLATSSQVQEVRRDVRRLSEEVSRLTTLLAGRVGGGGGSKEGIAGAEGKGVGSSDGLGVGGGAGGSNGFDRSYLSVSPTSPRLVRGGGPGFRVFDT